MQWLAEICVRRPVFATVLSLVILVVGSVSYAKLGVDQFPKIEFPYVMVITRLPGASPVRRRPFSPQDRPYGRSRSCGQIRSPRRISSR